MSLGKLLSEKKRQKDKSIENWNEEHALQTRTQNQEAGASSTAQEQRSEIIF